MVLKNNRNYNQNNVLSLAKIHNSKKGISNLLLAMLIILGLLIVYLVIISNRECNRDSDCGEYQYCGSDFTCHDKEVVYIERNSLLLPSLIIAIAMVITTLIAKWKDIVETFRK